MSRCRPAWLSRAWLSRACLVTLALAVAGCGSTQAPSRTAGSHQRSGISAPGLASSLTVAGGASWAVVEMGGSAANDNNFWELFVRPPGGTNWKLATPAGVASNGGIVVTASGPNSLLTGFRPSQDLTFSPLATTADAGLNWSQTNVLDAGLADVPGALASGPGGRLLAITDTGTVETGTAGGASWARLTTERALAASAAGHACGVTAITAAAWTPAGQPLLAADCRTAGTAAIFTRRAGAWQLTGLSLPPALHHAPVSVIGLNAAGSRITAILAAGTGRSTAVLAAWSADNASTWTVSSPLSTGPATAGPPSVSFGADGSAGLVLPATRAVSGGAVIGWRAAAWQSLPKLPADTATLAVTASGRPEALVVQRGTLAAWQLSGSGPHPWALLQTLQVAIPYGSSG
ncbi:MAG TPA: hypothetical protein VMA32_15140 [Streptosporangiaceae bacterium]|nr:hypothetical protein [Streptosporangiaceae bacterium]